MNNSKVSDLTIHELKALIRETVQEAVAEVLIEINTIADADAELIAEAEMAEFLKTSLQGMPVTRFNNTSQLDD